MRFRKRLFTALALLSILWIVGGFLISSDAYQETTQTSTDAAYNTGAAIGAGAMSTLSLCSGLILLTVFSLLAWRNGVGLKAEQRHKEQLEVMRG